MGTPFTEIVNVTLYLEAGSVILGSTDLFPSAFKDG
jgi:hypothetical protein